MTNGFEQTNNIHKGTFFAWFETGLEGLVWALQSDSDASIAGLVVLESSDWVEIRSASGEVLFEGEIQPDLDAGKASVGSALGRDQPTARGFWIHWTQAGFAPDDWARFFLPGNECYGHVRKAAESQCNEPFDESPR